MPDGNTCRPGGPPPFNGWQISSCNVISINGDTFKQVQTVFGQQERDVDDTFPSVKFAGWLGWALGRIYSRSWLGSDITGDCPPNDINQVCSTYNGAWTSETIHTADSRPYGAVGGGDAQYVGSTTWNPIGTISGDAAWATSLEQAMANAISDASPISLGTMPTINISLFMYYEIQ